MHTVRALAIIALDSDLTGGVPVGTGYQHVPKLTVVEGV